MESGLWELSYPFVLLFLLSPVLKGSAAVRRKAWPTPSPRLWVWDQPGIGREAGTQNRSEILIIKRDWEVISKLRLCYDCKVTLGYLRGNRKDLTPDQVFIWTQGRPPTTNRFLKGQREIVFWSCSLVCLFNILIAQSVFEWRNGGLVCWVWPGEKRMNQTDFIFFLMSWNKSKTLDCYSCGGVYF